MNNNHDHIKAYHAAADQRPEEGYEIPAQVAEFVSDESLEVMQHFGIEAASLLNNYACAVEDALIEQVKRANAAEAKLNELYEAIARAQQAREENV